MRELEMLCLANSWKHGGRCVAGVMKNGSWVRPVSATRSGELRHETCQLDVGRAVQPLDVVGLPVERHVPRPHQPENWLVGQGTWTFLRKARPLDLRAFLDTIATEEASLFGTDTNKVPWSQIEGSGVDESLALVRADRPTFGRNPDKPNQRRATFSISGAEYDLPISFEFKLPRPGEHLHRSPSTWYLTVSLGEPFRASGDDCYKLIAGALEMPADQ